MTYIKNQPKSEHKSRLYKKSPVIPLFTGL